MAKQKDPCFRSLLEIGILTCRTGPMKRFVADMAEVSHWLDQARNAMVRAWLRWREDHREWAPTPLLNADGQPKLTRKGKPIFPRDALAPGYLTAAGEPCEESEGTKFETYLYHMGRKAQPGVHSSLMTELSKEVLANLKTKADPAMRRLGHFYRWQAIFANDSSVPNFMARTIPVPNNAALFCYAGQVAGKGSGRELVEFWGKSSAVLSIPLFSELSGRAVRNHIATLRVGSLTPGRRALLACVAKGDAAARLHKPAERAELGLWKWADSKIVYKKGRWQLQFLCERPNDDLKLDKTRTATLWPQFPSAMRPFFLEAQVANKTWFCGNGDGLAGESLRLIERRDRIQNRRRHASGGRKGHGYERFARSLRTMHHKLKQFQNEFTWQLITEALKFCTRFDCGTLIYREPQLKLRDAIWLHKKGANFDWTSLRSNLSMKMRQYGIDLQVEQVGKRELSDRFGDEQSQTGKTLEK